MAAYDLTVQRPSLLAIPDTFNRSANNVLNAVRLAQERKNNEDKMELDSRRQSFIEGAPQRERDAQKALNQSLSGGLQTTRQNFIDNFMFDAQNRAAVEGDERFANATAEQQKAYWDTVTGKINANIGKNTDPRLYEGNLRAQLAKTSATQEQIDNYVANEMTRVYGTGDTELARTLAAASLRGSGTGSQGGYNKLPRMDDPGFSVEESDFVEKWITRVGASEGNGKTLFNPLSWFDPGGNNLTEQNINSYVTTMRNKHGLNAAQSLSALETIRDGDELGVNFKEMMDADIKGDSEASKALRKVVTAGKGMRNLRLEGTAAGGNQVNGSADFASILASASRRGTTVAQRRDLLFAELTTMFGPKAAKEMAEEATDSKVPESVVEKVKEEEPSANRPNNSAVDGIANIIAGNNVNTSSTDNAKNSLSLLGNNASEDIKELSSLFEREGLIGLLQRGLNNTPLGNALLSPVSRKSGNSNNVVNSDLDLLRSLAEDSGQTPVTPQQTLSTSNSSNLGTGSSLANSTSPTIVAAKNSVSNLLQQGFSPEDILRKLNSLPINKEVKAAIIAELQSAQ